jgi:hypothetical protein
VIDYEAPRKNICCAAVASGLMSGLNRPKVAIVYWIWGKEDNRLRKNAVNVIGEKPCSWTWSILGSGSFQTG